MTNEEFEKNFEKWLDAKELDRQLMEGPDMVPSIASKIYVPIKPSIRSKSRMWIWLAGWQVKAKQFIAVDMKCKSVGHGWHELPKMPQGDIGTLVDKVGHIARAESIVFIEGFEPTNLTIAEAKLLSESGYGYVFYTTKSFTPYDAADPRTGSPIDGTLVYKRVLDGSIAPNSNAVEIPRPLGLAEADEKMKSRDKNRIPVIPGSIAVGDMVLHHGVPTAVLKLGAVFTIATSQSPSYKLRFPDFGDILGAGSVIQFATLDEVNNGS